MAVAAELSFAYTLMNLCQYMHMFTSESTYHLLLVRHKQLPTCSHGARLQSSQSMILMQIKYGTLVVSDMG